MKLIIKLYTLFYTLYLKLFFYKRITIKGRISSNGFFTIEAARGARVIIERDVTFQSGVYIGVRKNAYLKISQGSFFNRNCTIIARDSVSIGKDALFGENVKIYDNNHKIIDARVSKKEYDSAPIKIGDYCWLANDVNVLMGSIIPNNSVIATKGVVNRELQDEGLYAGIPVIFKKTLS